MLTRPSKKATPPSKSPLRLTVSRSMPLKLNPLSKKPLRRSTPPKLSPLSKKPLRRLLRKSWKMKKRNDLCLFYLNYSHI